MPHQLPKLALTSTAFILAGLWSLNGWACSRIGHPPHQIQEALLGVDDTPPAPIEDIKLSITRATGPIEQGCGERSFNTCNGGSAVLEITPGFDEHTAPEDQGYIVEVVDGVLPNDFKPNSIGPFGIPKTSNISKIYFVLNWAEPGPETQDTVDFTLDISPVDAAGNVGQSTRIRIFDPVEDASCSATPLKRTPDPVFLLLLLGLHAIRRHARLAPSTRDA